MILRRAETLKKEVAKAELYSVTSLGGTNSGDMGIPNGEAYCINGVPIEALAASDPSPGISDGVYTDAALENLLELTGEADETRYRMNDGNEFDAVRSLGKRIGSRLKLAQSIGITIERLVVLPSEKKTKWHTSQSSTALASKEWRIAYANPLKTDGLHEVSASGKSKSKKDMNRANSLPDVSRDDTTTNLHNFSHSHWKPEF